MASGYEKVRNLILTRHLDPCLVSNTVVLGFLIGNAQLFNCNIDKNLNCTSEFTLAISAFFKKKIVLLLMK